VVAAAQDRVEIRDVDGVEWSQSEEAPMTAIGSLDGVSFDSSGR